MPSKNALTRSKMNQARLLLEQRRMDEAKSLLEKVCNIDRRNTEAWRLLGITNAIMGSHKEAERCFRAVVERHPEIADDHYNLGTSLLNQDRHEEAATCFRQAIRIRPDYSEAYCNLGSVLDSLHRMDEAVSCYREAIRHEPGRMELRYNLGQALKSQGKLEEAVDCFRVALQVQPGNFDIHFSLATTLVDQAKLDEAIDCYKLMVERGLGRPTVASNLLLALNYHPATDAQSIFAAHKHWEELYGRSATTYSSWPNTPAPDRPVRVGYVSPDYWDHSVSYFIEPILQHHNPQSVETFCYADNKRDDRVTERLKNLPLTWRETSGLGDADLCQTIRNDRIDILVDLAGHTGRNRLSVFFPQACSDTSIVSRLSQHNWTPFGGLPSHRRLVRPTGPRRLLYREADSPAKGFSAFVHLTKHRRYPYCPQKDLDMPPSAHSTTWRKSTRWSFNIGRRYFAHYPPRG